MSSLGGTARTADFGQTRSRRSRPSAAPESRPSPKPGLARRCAESQGYVGTALRGGPASAASSGGANLARTRGNAIVGRATDPRRLGPAPCRQRDRERATSAQREQASGRRRVRPRLAGRQSCTGAFPRKSCPARPYRLASRPGSRRSASPGGRSGPRLASRRLEFRLRQTNSPAADYPTVDPAVTTRPLQEASAGGVARAILPRSDC